MELQSVSVIVMIGLLFSGIVSIVFPIGLAVVGKKKYGVGLTTFFSGAFRYILFWLIYALVYGVFVEYILGLNEDNYFWAYCSLSALLVAYILEKGRVTGLNKLMKSGCDFSNAFMYGCGFASVKALLSGVAKLNLFCRAIMINSGHMTTQTSDNPTNIDSLFNDTISNMWTAPVYTFYVEALLAISWIILNIGLTLIIFKGVKEKKKLFIVLAISFRFIYEFASTAAYKQMPLWCLVIIECILAVVIFILAHKLSKSESVESE